MLRAELNEDHINIDYYSIKKSALILRAVNHALRHRIILLIESHKTITVTEIYTSLKIEQSVASQHLAILRKAGIVSVQRAGKKMYYAVEKEKLKLIEKLSMDIAW